MENLPKVLVVGINPWVDNTGINTLINFFDCWDKSKLAHIYMRTGLPDTAICDTFFQISEYKVIKSVFAHNIRTGMQVYNAKTALTDECKAENNIYSRKHNMLMTFARELVWKFGRWKTDELNGFIDGFNADILFMPVYSTVYMNRIQNYIAKHTGKPVVLYISDDNYTYKSVKKTPLSLLHRFWLRRQVKKSAENSTKMLVIAPKQKEEYDRIFGINCTVLTKGIDFSGYVPEFRPVSAPVKMTYTGKLIIGRDKSLAAIADAMGKINDNAAAVTLDIYTTDILTKKQKKMLNRNGCAVKGALILDEVLKVQKESDILVFVEDIKRKGSNAARLSFSTKITDYLKSGKCILSVGNKDTAPIDYFIRNDSAIVCSSEEEITEKLTELVRHPMMISSYGKKAYECGKKNHDKAVNDRLLKDLLEEIAFGKQTKVINHNPGI